MNSTDRTNTLRQVNERVGIKRVELHLDSIALQQLEALAALSGYEKKEKGSKNGVITYALHYLYSRCVIGEKAFKPKMVKRSQLKLIAENVVTWLFSKCESIHDRNVVRTLRDYPVPYDNDEKWTKHLVNNLSRVELGEKININNP